MKEFHKNDIEVLVELYFTGRGERGTGAGGGSFLGLRVSWDGVPVWVCAGRTAGVGSAVSRYEAISWFLDGVRIAKNGSGTEAAERRWHLGEYNEGFLIDMRRVLKGR